ncbi:unnamed protein product [Cylicocyclus nassatus]|uniref:S-adenosylmethionine mitochondrial carrier protein n=1 Tax=Cylicocyclus nassatus TaxID=53992 RepID=A0AA36M699_CYLNA|nr:unnamed protein product [Cylicocyclus nassatus]
MILRDKIFAAWDYFARLENIVCKRFKGVYGAVEDENEEVHGRRYSTLVDTIKTRLQSKQGFFAAGGFRHIYSGMGSVAIGSAPGAALFFVTYRSVNGMFNKENWLVRSFSASIAEIVACAIRVPTELVKQRMQASSSKRMLSDVCIEIYKSDNLRGFYRGYVSTIIREIPFSIIQFPLWEYWKDAIAARKGRECSPLEGAACGSAAGLVAAAITTPLDVAKTRIMLSTKPETPSIMTTLKEVYSTGGVKALFSGVTPRVLWLALGGFVFFGAYETVLSLSYWVCPDKKHAKNDKS